MVRARLSLRAANGGDRVYLWHGHELDRSEIELVRP
jgi:hypothetical protein